MNWRSLCRPCAVCGETCASVVGTDEPQCLGCYLGEYPWSAGCAGWVALAGELVPCRGMREGNGDGSCEYCNASAIRGGLSSAPKEAEVRWPSDAPRMVQVSYSPDWEPFVSGSSGLGPGAVAEIEAQLDPKWDSPPAVVAEHGPGEYLFRSAFIEAEFEDGWVINAAYWDLTFVAFRPFPEPPAEPELIDDGGPF